MKLFISYARKDDVEVKSLVNCLRHEGIEVFWDRAIAPDADWSEFLEREILEADRLLVVWSSASIESDPVRQELEFAKCHGIDVFQCRIERVAPPVLAHKHCVDLSRWAGNSSDPGWRSLIEAMTGESSDRRSAVGLQLAKVLPDEDQLSHRHGKPVHLSRTMGESLHGEVVRLIRHGFKVHAIDGNCLILRRRQRWYEGLAERLLALANPKPDEDREMATQGKREETIALSMTQV